MAEEIWAEQKRRLEMMTKCEHAEEMWDLGPNDKTAIRAALRNLDAVTTSCAELLAYECSEESGNIVAPHPAGPYMAMIERAVKALEMVGYKHG